MKEFMLQWQEGQEYLISERKLRWRYEHGIMNDKYRKTVDRELTVRQFEIIRNNPDNGYYSFFYNGERQVNISIDTASDPNLVIIKCRDRFPGYALGHTARCETMTDSEREMTSRYERETGQTQADLSMAAGHCSDPGMQGIESYPVASHQDAPDCAVSGQICLSGSQDRDPKEVVFELQKRLQHDSHVDYPSMPELQGDLDPLGIQVTIADPYRAETSRCIERWFAANPQQ